MSNENVNTELTGDGAGCQQRPVSYDEARAIMLTPDGKGRLKKQEVLNEMLKNAFREGMQEGAIKQMQHMRSGL